MNIRIILNKFFRKNTKIDLLLMLNFFSISQTMQKKNLAKKKLKKERN